MTLLSALDRLIFGPLELLFEVIFTVAYHNTALAGISILLLSVAINFLLLPLYRRADAIQEEERVQSQEMKPTIDHIRKTFQGDERFMILQTCYRQNNYKPYFALKGILPLMLEIPFFIAAYRFLSGLSILSGASFGPIRDLSRPDALLAFGGVTVNLLPVLMTAINIISGMIYTRGMPLRSKIQLYGMAGVFLVLLYQSPSGLVLYWTMNNLFSLVKNLFCRLRHPGKVLCGILAALGVALLAWLVIRPLPEARQQIMRMGIAVMMVCPLLLSLFLGRHPGIRFRPASRGDGSVFLACCVFMTVLLGVMIPSAVISASPSEFVSVTNFRSPLRYVLLSGIIAAGTFLIWFRIYYLLASPSARRGYSFAMLALSGVAAVDYMFFGKNYGNMSANLQYDELFVLTGRDYLVNGAVLAGVVLLLLLIWKKLPGLTRAVSLGCCLAVVAASAVNISAIQAETNRLKASIDFDQLQEEPVIPLDRNEKNVVVIILDRAINRYFPYLIEEKPELRRQFAGFTYYPNTISYGNYTVCGIPAVYGGYEYTPEAINARADEPLKDKHNESLKVMPVSFLNHGYDVTVCGAAYAGFQMIPDLSIYDDYPQIHKYLMNDRYQVEEFAGYLNRDSRERNFFCYSVMRAAPVMLHYSLYTFGQYNQSGTDSEILGIQTREGLTKAQGLKPKFMDNYAVLTHLKDMTSIRGKGRGTFMIMHNETTHEECFLQAPDYVPALKVDNTAYEAEHGARKDADGHELIFNNDYQMEHYHVNMASLLQVGKWLDMLREQGVYDNTRIIIVSDHGKHLGQLGLRFGNRLEEDIMWYNPLLLVKDFGSTELTTDHTFMTNADTPLIAFRGLIDDPVNPMTGKAMTDDTKKQPEQHLFASIRWNPGDLQNDSQFTYGYWITMNNDVDDIGGWHLMNP